MEWLDELRRSGGLSDTLKEKITSVHGDRGEKAIEAVQENRVKQYRDFTVVVGVNDEYIIEGGSCTCMDYRFNLDEDEKCWHLLASIVADELDLMDRHDMWYSDVRDFL